jgi:hypothetical protein
LKGFKLKLAAAVQVCGPTVPEHKKTFDRCLSHYPRARMDRHSSSESDDAAPDDAEYIPDLYDSDEDGDEADQRPRFALPSSQWKAKMRDDEEEPRYASESGDDEGQLSEGDAQIPRSESEAEVEDDPDPVSNSGPGSVDMFVRLSEMANQFMETVKEMRKSSKVSKGHASPPPAKQRKKKLVFTPPRNAPDVVMQTQEMDEEDIERDSVSSQSSRVPRKRLLAPWKLIDVKLKSKVDRSEAMNAFSEIAAADLAKAGTSDDYRIPEDSFGGFKPAQVMLHVLSSKLYHDISSDTCFLFSGIFPWQNRILGLAGNIGTVRTGSAVPVTSVSA